LSCRRNGGRNQHEPGKIRFEASDFGAAAATAMSALADKSKAADKPSSFKAADKLSSSGVVDTDK
jgi:hypothetical protein